MALFTTDSLLELTASEAGAQVRTDGVHYAVWAPDHAALGVEVMRASGGEITIPLAVDESGHFSGRDAEGRAGDRYCFVTREGRRLPDPRSRFQPDGVHNASEVIDPGKYEWCARDWRRPGWRGQAIYEVHVGTFTEEGTFRAAIERLDHIAALGVEAIELMPVADFAGRWNWGYDGVALFAPARCYGRPDDLRALVDAAHERGLAMILDVVYNHLGPDGNHLGGFGRGYFDPERHTPWGQGFRLSGPGSQAVRDLFLANAAYWLDEYRFDGLRLDATHTIEDNSERHLLAEIAAVVHARDGFTIAEDERNSCVVLHQPDGTGWGIDAAWSDDFHHQVRVALTGTQESYFQSYSGSPADLARTMEQGWFFTGQSYPQWNGRARGGACRHLPPSAFVYCIENHDQVGNRAKGERLEHLIAPSAFRAASALLCLGPYPPLIFMGQEWAAGTPFMFFTDHTGELGRQVTEGRRKELGHGSLEVPDPQEPATFLESKLSWEELRFAPHAAVLALYRACLRQRGLWINDVAADRGRWTVVSCERAVAIRYRGVNGSDRLLISSLQGDTRISLRDDPQLQAPADSVWRLVFDSNGGCLDTVDTRPAWTAPISDGSGCVAVDAVVFSAPATLMLVTTRLVGKQDA